MYILEIKERHDEQIKKAHAAHAAGRRSKGDEEGQGIQARDSYPFMDRSGRGAWWLALPFAYVRHLLGPTP